MEIDELQFTVNETSSLPKYRQLANCLEEWLRETKLPGGTRLPGDRQLAEQFATTPVTVSKSLNELTRKGVLERRVGSGTYVKENGLPRTCRIGIICHEVINPDAAYITPVLQSFHHYWIQKDYQVISLIGEPKNYRKLIREYDLAGVMILVPREDFFPSIQLLRQQGTPVVSIGFANPEFPEFSFGTDHEKISEQAVEYLYRQGHRRIGIVATTQQQSSSVIRKRGYANGMWKAGLPVKPDWELGAGGTKFLEKEFQRIFKQPDHPTALLIPELPRIMQVYNICRKMNLQIPEDLSLVGFDDAEYIRQLMPPLTVFAQRIDEFTQLASLQLENMIRRRPLDRITERYSDAKLIERQSCRNIQNN